MIYFLLFCVASTPGIKFWKGKFWDKCKIWFFSCGCLFISGVFSVLVSVYVWICVWVCEYVSQARKGWMVHQRIPNLPVSWYWHSQSSWWESATECAVRLKSATERDVRRHFTAQNATCTCQPLHVWYDIRVVRTIGLQHSLLRHVWRLYTCVFTTRVYRYTQNHKSRHYLAGPGPLSKVGGPEYLGGPKIFGGDLGPPCQPCFDDPLW